MSPELNFPPTPGRPAVSALLKATAEDFKVDEVLGFEPTGDGEHLYLHVRKQNLNTTEVQQRIADDAGVALRQVSFSGMKDRHGLTSQWFSVQLPGQPEPVWNRLKQPGIELLQAAWHQRKLRRGTHRANHFCLYLRNVEGDQAALEQRLQAIAGTGFPNYFGHQRFGRGGSNLARALTTRNAAKLGRAQRGFVLSAARSYLFNQVLAARVTAGNWNTLVDGDAAVLAGSASFFPVVSVDEELRARCASFDIHPSGPLWGGGALSTVAAVAELESGIVRMHSALASLLEMAQLRQERRALRVMPANLGWKFINNTGLELQFSLPRGCYATALLDELLAYENVSLQRSA